MLQNRLDRLIFIFLVISILSSCGLEPLGPLEAYGLDPEFEKCSVDSLLTPAPTSSAIDTSPAHFKADIKQVIADILDPSFGPLRDNFAIFGSTQPENADVILLGEVHANQEIELLENQALNRLVRKGDVILYEGIPSGNIVSCHDEAVLNVYGARQWRKKGRKYDVSDYDDFIAGFITQWFDNKFNDKKNIAFLGLSLINAECFGWDNLKSFKTVSAYWSLRERNQSMLATIKQFRQQGKRVFVVGGQLHLPEVDYADWHRQKALFGLTGGPESKEDFFQASKDGPVKGITDHGSTVDLYEYLKTQNYSVMVTRSAMVATCYDRVLKGRIDEIVSGI